MINEICTPDRSQQIRLLRSVALPNVPGTRTATLKAVLKLVAEYANLKDGVCWASQERIAGDLGLSVATVRRSLKALQAIGVIAWERKSRGGRMTLNHYRLVWSELAKHASTAQDNRSPLTEQPIITAEQPVTVSPSIVHHERQEESEKRKKTTTVAVVDSFNSSLELAVRKLHELLAKLNDRLSALLGNTVEAAPAHLSSDWRTVERELSKRGIKYASKAVDACRRRGETIDDVRSIIRRDGLTVTQIANRLIHGTALPQPRTNRPSNEQPNATELWERFCSFCKLKSLDRHKEFWRFEQTLKSKNMELPTWLKLEAA